MRRPSSIGIAAAVVLGGLVAAAAGAAPANAAAGAAAANVTNCSSWQSKRFALPRKPDHEVRMKTCVQRDGNYLRAYVKWEETDVTDHSLDQKRFDMFIIGTRLERYDADIAWKNCDIVDDMNDWFYGLGTCHTAWVHSTLDGGWTGDSTVSYDIDNDGKDGYAWGLTGSPTLY
jgi:hypothetical protein